MFAAIQSELHNNSIYRGKAITASETPQFIDTSSIDFADIVYTEQVQEDIEVFIWANVLYPRQLRDINQLGKRLTIVYGYYGGGKTELARLTARLCEDQLAGRGESCGFIMVRPGIDNWMYAIQMARLYGRCVIFIEDADLLAPADNPEGIQMLLDQLDGLMVKGLDISMVFTTNHIHQDPEGSAATRPYRWPDRDRRDGSRRGGEAGQASDRRQPRLGGLRLRRGVQGDGRVHARLRQGGVRPGNPPQPRAQQGHVDVASMGMT